VVFVTAYDEFAVRAFEAHAVDYLVKPIEEVRFAAALARTRERMRSMAALELTERLSCLLSAHERERLTMTIRAARLVVPTSTGDLILDANEIDWIEADDYYAAIHARGRRHLIRQSLATLEQRLDSRFVRAHRGAIVNIERVRELRAEHGDTVLLLRDGTRVPVSRRRREQVTRCLRVLAG
jgi:two-component system LytT family response regulator